MTEEQYKFICKQIVEYSERPLSEFDKELMKQGIDNAKSVPELIASILAVLSMT